MHLFTLDIITHVASSLKVFFLLNVLEIQLHAACNLMFYYYTTIFAVGLATFLKILENFIFYIFNFIGFYKLSQKKIF